MTARQVFEGVLTELSKVKAPSISLDEFNYFFNKAVNLYINKQYNGYDVNQQTTDSCRVLKASAQLVPTKVTDYTTYKGETNLAKFSNNMIESLYGATYEVNFPVDYLHILNCVCIFKVKELFKCWEKGSFVLFGATRLTADSWSTIINDFYNRPLPWRPYYYIHHVNTSNTLPTNAFIPDDSCETLGSGTDWNGMKKIEVDNREFITTEDGKVIHADDTESIIGSENSNYAEVEFPLNLARELKISANKKGSLVEKTGGVRYGNASSVRCEFRFGKIQSLIKQISFGTNFINYYT